jgi:hypothetical protein
MTPHDQARANRASATEGKKYTSKKAEMEALEDAILGLQSTDDPSLVDQYHRLCERLEALEKESA